MPDQSPTTAPLADFITQPARSALGTLRAYLRDAERAVGQYMSHPAGRSSPHLQEWQLQAAFLRRAVSALEGVIDDA